jgi:hypothetical protein
MGVTRALTVGVVLLCLCYEASAGFEGYLYVRRKPTDAAARASQELKLYLERITGATVPVVTEGKDKAPGGLAILVGDSDRARSLGFDSTKLKPEQIRIKSGEGWLVVIGCDRGPTGFELAGTQWAAYELLERLGVRWLWPGPLGEVVPSKPDLVMPDLDVDYTPPIIQRKIRDIEYHERVQAGLDKLGLTREQFEAVHADGPAWFRRQRLGTQGEYNYGHAFGHWWDAFHVQHPDWFALQPSGTRDQGNIGDRARLCVSNPEVTAQVAAEACAKLASHPGLICASISPNDGGRATFCLCEKCRALDPPEAPPIQVWHPTQKDFTIPSLTDRYVWFYNHVAEIVAAKFPDRYLGAYAYSAYRLPPVREKLHPKVFIGFVGLSYLNEDARQRDLASWDAWSKMAQRFFLRPNLLGGGQGFPALYPHRMVADLKHCFETGMTVTDFDCCYQHWALQGLNYYVLARFLWDPSIDVDAVIDDYCRTGWGPAAEPVKQYFAVLEQLVDRVAADRTDAGRKEAPELLARYYTDEVLASCQALLDQARELGKENSGAKQRVEFLQTGLSYTRLNRDRVIALAAMKSGSGTKEAYVAADKALADCYRQMGITQAVNSPWMKFYGF